MNKTTKQIKANLIAIAVLFTLTIAIVILAQFKNIAEWWVNVYRELAYVSLDIYKGMKFDAFEWFMFSLALASVVCLGFIIYYFVHKNKQEALRLLTVLLIIIMAVVFIFVFMSYPLYKRDKLNIKEEETLLTNDQARAIAYQYFDDFNNLVDSMVTTEDGVWCKYSDLELEQMICEAYKILDDNPYFARVYAEPKKIAFSAVMNWFSIAGITSMPTIEPGYNKLMPMQDKCVAIAHELAHTRGIMREDDANETAYYVLLNADNEYLRYVGYLYTCYQMLYVLILTNTEFDVSILPKGARIDLVESTNYWEENGVLDKIGDAINSLYLKINGQDGTKSYGSYDTHEENKTIDEEGNEVVEYTVTSYSHVQNMIFALYNS